MSAAYRGLVMWLSVFWVASVAVGALVAAAKPKTVWWHGAVSGALLGPLGVLVVASGQISS